MEGWVWIRFLEAGGDPLGIHDVGSIREADYGYGVGFRIDGRGVGWDTKGLEMGDDMVEFDPLGSVGDLFVVEDEARWGRMEEEMLVGLFLAVQNGGGPGVRFTFPCVGRPGGTVAFAREIEKNDGWGFGHVLLLETDRRGWFEVKSWMEQVGSCSGRH